MIPVIIKGILIWRLNHPDIKVDEMVFSLRKYWVFQHVLHRTEAGSQTKVFLEASFSNKSSTNYTRLFI